MRGADLSGANCADLVHPEYFFDTTMDRLRVKAAKNICGRCVVLDECRVLAINGPQRKSGVIAGMTPTELRAAKAWRSYELGYLDAAPRGARPEWLERPEAAETVEQMRLELEVGVDR